MNTQFRNLIFEGGGVKGIAYGGALQVLESNQVLSNIQRVAGTSAGAISACLLAVGYSVSEITDELSKLNFSLFKDKSWFPPNNWFRLLNKYGYYKGDFFHSWLGEKIKNKTGNADFNFNHLNKAIGENEKKFRQLFIVSTNLSQQIPDVFSHENNNSPSIRMAVRMSMSIPLFFASVKNKNNTMVDGGVSWNYPINLFDNKRYKPKEGNYETVVYDSNPNYVFNHETLGFRLDSKSVIDYAKNNWSIPPEPVTNIKQYALALVNFMSEMANRTHLHSNDWARTIFIDTGKIQTTQFNLSADDINDLIKRGKEYTDKYFQWRNNDPHYSKLPS